MQISTAYHEFLNGSLEIGFSSRRTLPRPLMTSSAARPPPRPSGAAPTATAPSPSPTCSMRSTTAPSIWAPLDRCRFGLLERDFLNKFSLISHQSNFPRPLTSSSTPAPATCGCPPLTATTLPATCMSSTTARSPPPTLRMALPSSSTTPQGPPPAFSPLTLAR